MDQQSSRIMAGLPPALKCAVFLFLFFSLCTHASLDVSNINETGKIHLAEYYRVSLSTHVKTIEQALISDTFVPVSTAKKIPNFEGHIWLKLELENNSLSEKSLIWVGNYPKVRDLEMTILRGDKPVHHYHVDERFSFLDRPLPHHLFSLPITIAPFQSLTIYIKPHTLGFNITHRSELQSEQYFFFKNNRFEFLHFFYFGILFIMCLYSLLIFIMLGERSYLYYSGFVGSSLLFYLCNSGYAFQYFWPDHPFLNQRIIYVALACLFSFAGWFSISFLSLKTRSPIISKAIKTSCISCLLFLIYFLPQPFDPSYANIRLLSLFSLPIYSLCFLGGILTWYKYRDRNAGNYTLAWSILIFVSLMALVNEDFFKFFEFDVLALLQITHGIEILVLSMTLAVAISELKIKENLAQAKAETQSRFLAKMSHEIRTPMNAILGIADVLKSRLTDSKEKHYADVIYTNADSLGKIINDILDYSSIEAGKLKIIEKPFSLKVMTDNLCALFELDITNKLLRFQLIIDAKVPNQFIGDRQRVQQILVNLISNAIKYTPDGLISLEITVKNSHLNFHVKDTGIGIAKEDQPRLFRPFEQMHNNHLSSEYSTGLGLAICLDLAKAMYGTLDVVSEPSKGSVFTLSLPLKPYIQKTIPTTGRIDNRSQLHYKSILIIEDNATNSLVIGAILEKLGLSFHISSNGIEGFTYFKAQANCIDLIFMDCEMPLMDGYESTKAIRTFENKQQPAKTPIIALTANTWPKQLEKCFRVGMDDLLLKPINIDRVHSILTAFEPPSTFKKEHAMTHHSPA